MATDAQERITWLRYEFAETLDRYQRGEIDARQLAAAAAQLSSHAEVEKLRDELLQHTFWAMQHVLHRPACWAPTPREVDYLVRCLRDEEIFDPQQVEFTYQSPATK